MAEDPKRRKRRRWTTTDLVAVILAGSMGSAINLFILAAVAEAWANPITLPVGLSDNATQVLTGWGGGIIGVIGALVGVRVGRTDERKVRRVRPPGDDLVPDDLSNED